MKKAILFMLISTLSFSIMNAFIKYLDNIPSFQLVFFRSVTSFVIALSFLFKNKISPLGKQRKLLMTRAIFGVISMSLFFMSFKYLAIGTAVSLRYIAPIFAAIFAVFILKEKLKPIQWLYFLVAFIGVIVLKGFDSGINNIGLILVLSASVFTGLVYITIRKIGKTEHPVVIVNYFMFTATVMGGILSIHTWVSPMSAEWFLLGSLGVFGYFGQLYMTKAFQIASTDKIAPIKYMEVVFTICIGVFWFSDSYSLTSFLGLFLIISALIANTLVKKDKP